MFALGMMPILRMFSIISVLTQVTAVNPVQAQKVTHPKPVVKAVHSAKIVSNQAEPAAGPISVTRTVNGHKLVALCGEAGTCHVPLHQLLAEKQIGSPRNVVIVIEKSKRLLKLVVNGEVVKSYVVSLGKMPDAEKISRGDKATPVGDYYVCQKNPYSRFYLALKISYPNAEDAERGLRQGLINQAMCSAIKCAINAHGVPPMDTRLGGNICIHGGGAGYMEKSGGVAVEQVRDWTAGCIALDNPQMKELFDFVPAGAKVEIRP